MTNRHRISSSIGSRKGARFVAATLSLALLGCPDEGGGDDGASESSSGGAEEDTTVSPSTSTSGGPTTSAESSSGSSGDEGTSGSDDGEDSGESSSDSGAVEPMLEVLVDFDPAMGQLPEGLALGGDDAFVAFAPTGQVYRVDTTGPGEAEPFASVPPLPPNEAFITGLAFDDEDRLLVALPSFAAAPQTGIYRAPAEGGDATLFATHANMLFPSAIRQAEDGSIYVTDSFAGAIFRIDASGDTDLWVSDDLLVGDKTFCGHDEALFSIGANGLVIDDDRLVVAVTHAATLVEIPIEPRGTAGTPEVIVGPDCDAIGGIDGMDLAADGSIYAAINAENKIVRIDPSGAVETIVEDPALDSPATVRIGDAGGQPALYFTNFALASALAGLEASPSLARWWPLQ